MATKGSVAWLIKARVRSEGHWPELLSGWGMQKQVKGEGGMGGGEGGEGGEGGKGGEGGRGGEGGEGGRGGGEGEGGDGGEGGVKTGYISKETTLPSTEGRAGKEMEMLKEVKFGRHTFRSVVQGPNPSALDAAEQLAGRTGVAEVGVTETEVLTRGGLRSLICKKE